MKIIRTKRNVLNELTKKQEDQGEEQLWQSVLVTAVSLEESLHYASNLKRLLKIRRQFFIRAIDIILNKATKSLFFFI